MVCEKNAIEAAGIDKKFPCIMDGEKKQSIRIDGEECGDEQRKR